MAKVSVYNMEGNQVGEIELDDAVFGVEVNEHLVHLAVVAQLAKDQPATIARIVTAILSQTGTLPVDP